MKKENKHGNWGDIPRSMRASRGRLPSPYPTAVNITYRTDVQTHLSMTPFTRQTPTCTGSSILHLRALPSAPSDRQVPPDKLFLNDLPSSYLLLLVYRRLAVAVYFHVRHSDFQLLELRRLEQLLGLLAVAEGVVEVG